VDVEAATKAGIFVMNSPGGNLVSTCELTMALILATSRNIAAADASLKAGTWDRKAFAGGAEISGKRIGIVGFGRIGREVAARCKAFGMEVWAFDPFVSGQVAERVGVKAVTLDQILEGCDYITLHTVMTPDTRHMLGKEAFAKIKPGVRIINAARGELIDEDALHAALEDGRVAGCGLDVHAKEPPVDWKIAKHTKVVATPHIGAQTLEAQDRVGTDIAYQVRDFLKDGVIQQAVNFFQLSGEAYDQIKPAIDLGERLGSLLAQVTPGEIRKVEVTLYGTFKDLQARPILQATVAGALKVADPEITFVNAMARAESRGIEVAQASSSSAMRHTNLMGVKIATAEAELAVAGTLFGEGQLRLVEIDGIPVDAVLHGHMLAIKNDDTPGVVGRIGTKLGERGVNIAQMNLGRKSPGGRAVMLIEVDAKVPPEVLAMLLKIDGVREARAITLG
jgi:D-3-phosphoglycerate dehydrogenase